jgi:hypothetical protein
MNKFKFYLLSLLFLAFVSSLFLGKDFAFADNYGLENTAGSAGLTSIADSGDVTKLAGNVVGTALSMIGILFFVLMIYAGLRWMTARGNSELTQKALDTIIAAVIGMVIVLASYALTNFVFSSANGLSRPTNSAVSAPQ